MATLLSSPAHQELSRLVDASRARLVRPYNQWLDDELIIPEGKHEGKRFRREIQPVHGLIADAIATGRWARHAITGCVQGGKSLFGYAAPCCYHLFEVGENVILGAPTEELGKTKYRNEVLPVIRRNPRLRRFLPESGPGSREGVPDEIIFRNGAHLKFMSGKGSDAERSSYTARVVVVTETDKLDRPGEVSRETSPVRQMEARASSWDEPDRRVFLECTVSIESGAIWQELQNGTRSRFVMQCKDCQAWVTPEREHLHGWQDAERREEAKRLAFWICAECGGRWDEAARRRMMAGVKLLHTGQSIDREGRITGEPIPTDTFSVRWNAFHNLFWSTATIAAGEWSAARAVNEELAEREQRQFVWAIPYEPPELDLTPLNPQKLKRRVRRLPKGLLPEDTEHVTVGVDLGKRVGWWKAFAWGPEARGHVPGYGSFEIPSDDLGVERALAGALRDFADRMEEIGFLKPDGEIRIPDQVWIDARYQGPVVYAFCRERGVRYRPCLGFGFGQERAKAYHRPTKTGNIVRHIGEEYHIVWSPQNGVFIVEVNADYWKSWYHERLATPIDPEAELPPGAMLFYGSADGNEHLTLVKHLTAEKQVEEFIPDRGRVVRWVTQSRANHLLDAGALGCCAGHLCGVRVVRPAAPPAAPSEPAPEHPPLGPGWRPEVPMLRRGGA